MAQSTSDDVIFLDQAWSQDDREWYYQFSQGSHHHFVRHLPESGGRRQPGTFPFGCEQRALRPDPPGRESRTNPDGLPIGLAKTVVTEGRMEGRIRRPDLRGLPQRSSSHYQGKRIRIDGGVGNTFDLMAYIYALDDALQATVNDTAKFDRLAARLGASSPDAKSELRQRFESDAARVHQYRTRTLVAPVAWGPARMDAIALIVNRLTAVATGHSRELVHARSRRPSRRSSGMLRRVRGRNGAACNRIRSNAT